ncbi:outer membrane beta-barrel protein, partial [Prevotella sp.]|uniref:outer membrane beta-barrel protein n=1 Tax=Prevotella sp. TaxID=59823 RepID=UPI0027E31421
EQFDAIASWNDVTDITRSSSEQFASAGNIFNRSASTSVQKEFRLYANNQITYTDESKFYLQSSTSFNYGDGTNNSSSERSTFDSEGNMTADTPTNRSQTISLTKFRTTSVNENLMFGFVLPWGDMLGFNLNGSYTSNKPQDSFSLSNNEYLRENKNDLRRVYADSHNNSYNYGASANYSVKLNNWQVGLSQAYNQSMTSTNQLNYRLERLGGLYNRFDQQQLDRLPSTRDSLLLALDMQNSKKYSLLTRQYKGEPTLRYNHNNTYFSLKLPYRLVRERINYNCASVDTTAVRRKWLVEPSLYFNKWNKKYDISLNYSLSSNQPDMESLMPIDNDINPLARRINNPNLKTSVTHNLSGYAGFNFKNKSRLSVGFNSSLYMDMIGTRTIYNTKTGAYTYMNDNVHSGNWTLNTNADYTGKLDKKGLFAIETRLSLDYTKSTDFDIAYDADINNAASTLSRVYTSILRDYLKLSFQKGDLSLALVADAQWRNSTSNRDNFQTLNAYDYNYGMTLSYKLPLGIQLATDLKQYSRRGYGDSSMNTDDLVWNASLARSFCKGRLTLTAEGFDILHQLSNTTCTVNAQGRTEVWRNTIPNYVMMHVAYKLTKMPKKK